jgi:Protein of unknown function (DUF3667)
MVIIFLRRYLANIAKYTGANKTLLFLTKLTSLSHLKERKQKNCLNCNARVYGKYCHICGQENTEPAESAWHLVTHFFNDITHFDGKFFSTLRLLITRPGFLSAEYKIGRRANYLNPVRMYIFTSFVFFLVFFSLYQVDEKYFNFSVEGVSVATINKMDSAAFSQYTKGINKGKAMTRQEYLQYIDSSRKAGLIIFDTLDMNRAQYDSMKKAGLVKEYWLKQKIRNKLFEINEKYKDNQEKAIVNVFNILFHNFPQILFVSLPLFAVFFKLLYIRHKDYYFVSHGIYTIHLYIFYFIALLAMILLNELSGVTHWNWLTTLAKILIFLLFIYEYKAMRNFYGQGRFKTIVKFILAGMWRFIVIMILFILFLFLSILKV